VQRTAILAPLARCLVTFLPPSRRTRRRAATAPPHAARAQDLYVGCRITVFKRMFELLDADEYTYTYMENNKHIFIMADADAILASLRAQAAGKAAAVRAQLLAADAGGQGFVGSEQVQQALAAAGLKFTRHQVVSLCRRMDRERTGTVLVSDLLAALNV
jgi:hypothetical protein